MTCRICRLVIASILLGLPVGSPVLAEAKLDGDNPLPVYYRSATALGESIRAGEITPSELLEILLERIERLNPEINAIVAIDIGGARKRAAEADAALARGVLWGPLHGLPITVKDMFSVPPMPTTLGNPVFADYRPASNAVAVQRLLDAGAIVMGKTNLPVNGLDWQTYNPLFGTTNNPWDLARTPGGSSGGSAAALSAGLSAFELGSDIGGSIRVPSHFTGVYGHQPTFGVVPRAGPLPFEWNDRWSVAGPLARSADDLEMLLEILAAPTDEGGDKIALLPSRRSKLKDYRVAAWLNDPAVETDRAVAEVLVELVRRLRDAGVAVNEAARPEFTLEQNIGLYMEVVAYDLFRVFPASGEAESKLKEIRNKWAEFFIGYDVVLSPVSPTVAFPHDQSADGNRTLLVNGEARRYDDNAVWQSLSILSGLPATVAPAGRSSSGLPVGVQIIGPRLGDRTTIDFARRLEALRGGFVPPPGS